MSVTTTCIAEYVRNGGTEREVRCCRDILNPWVKENIARPVNVGRYANFSRAL